MRLAVLALATPLLLTPAALADSFEYSFSSADYSTAFTYFSPTLLTTASSFAATTCTYQGGLCNVTALNPAAGTLTVGYTSGPSSNTSTFIDLPTSFFTLGTHANAAGTLSIAEIASVLYLFSSPSYATSFTYNSPGLITTGTTFTAQTCTHQNNPCNLTGIDPVAGQVTVGGPVGSLNVDDTFTHLPPSFFTPGLHTGPDGVASLTVDPIPATLTSAPVPEPSSIALLGTGLLGAVRLLRRKSAF